MPRDTMKKYTPKRSVPLARREEKRTPVNRTEPPRPQAQPKMSEEEMKRLKRRTGAYK
jgi:hypothetical protein